MKNDDDYWGEHNIVINLDDYSKHYMIQSIDGNVHVIPYSTFENIADGTLHLHSLEYYDKIIPTIIQQWLDK